VLLCHNYKLFLTRNIGIKRPDATLYCKCTVIFANCKYYRNKKRETASSAASPSHLFNYPFQMLPHWPREPRAALGSSSSTPGAVPTSFEPEITNIEDSHSTLQALACGAT
jgi:hypothetical protein